MNHLLILNDPRYGTERSFNRWCMAHAFGAITDPATAGDIVAFRVACERIKENIARKAK